MLLNIWFVNFDNRELQSKIRFYVVYKSALNFTSDLIMNDQQHICILYVQKMFVMEILSVLYHVMLSLTFNIFCVILFFFIYSTHTIMISIKNNLIYCISSIFLVFRELNKIFHLYQLKGLVACGCDFIIMPLM